MTITVKYQVPGQALTEACALMMYLNQQHSFGTISQAFSTRK